MNIVVEATLTKGESGSYDDRANMDAAALDTVENVPGSVSAGEATAVRVLFLDYWPMPACSD